MTLSNENAVVQLVGELMRAGRRGSAETGVFKIWKHDDDLLPRLSKRLNSTLDSLRKYSADVYDVQGMRDAGTDLAIKSASDPTVFVCFQVKSNDDFARPGLEQTLKQQSSSRRLRSESFECLQSESTQSLRRGPQSTMLRSIRSNLFSPN